MKEGNHSFNHSLNTENKILVPYILYKNTTKLITPSFFNHYFFYFFAITFLIITIIINIIQK